MTCGTAQRCCPRHAGLPARCGSSLQRNDAGVWLCEYPGLSFQRSPVCACSLVSSLLLSRGYDEPAILSYAISSFCPTSADGLHVSQPFFIARLALWDTVGLPRGYLTL